MKDKKSVIGGLFCFGFFNKLKMTILALAVLSQLVNPVYAFEFNNTVSYEEVVTDYKPPIAPSEREIQCLAKNIYFEARGESYLGQKAVAFVTLNRVNSGSFPDNVCDVVYQRSSGGCQFHWVCMKGLRIVDFTAFEQAKQLAFKVLTMYNDIADPSGGALYFHAKTVQTMIRSSRITATIGQHRFYK